MSGNLDDLEFGLKVDLDESLNGLRQVAGYVNLIRDNLTAVGPRMDGSVSSSSDLSDYWQYVNRDVQNSSESMRRFAEQAQQAATTPAAVLEPMTAPQDLQQSQSVDFSESLQGFREVSSSLDSVRNEIGYTGLQMESALDQSKSLAVHWDHVHGAMERGTNELRRMANQAAQTASATQTIVIQHGSQQATQGRPQSAFELTKFAAMAVAANTLNRTMASVNTVFRTTTRSVTEIGKSTVSTIGYMDRFRAGLAAPAADQSMNVVKKALDKVGDAAAETVRKVTGAADAVMSDIPGIAGSVAKNMAKATGELDKTSLAMSKHISKGQSMSKGMTLLKWATLGLANGAINKLQGPLDKVTTTAEKVADSLDTTNSVMNVMANKARNAQFIMSGTFQKLEGSADRFAKAMYHANLPARLLMREVEGATRVVRAAAHVFNFVTTPITKVRLAIKHSAEDFRVFRSELPRLTSGLQLGTRAYRAFAHGTYFASSALKPLTAGLGWAGTQIWNLVRPARAAKVGLDGVAVGGQKAGIVLRGVSAAASTTAGALSRVGTAGAKMASGSATSFLSALPGRAMMGATALAGMAIAAGGFGAQFAMATEKNQAVFGVMLKDMDQGKAVVASLQDSKAVGLFDNDEVLNSGRLLFKAGVAATDLKGKTEQLATIAAATSTELGDLTRIYQQGANRGSFGQDKINQMAERGIDIYHALEATTGKSGAALADMISSGKIGVGEMDAALAHLTEGNGIYAGSLQTLAGATGGMLSQIKNNLLQALGGLSGVGLEAFKPILAGVLSLSEGIKTSIGAVAPVVTQAFMVIKAAFTGIWQVVTSTFTGIFGAGAATFQSLLGVTMDWVTKFRWYFENFIPIAKFVWLNVGLSAITTFNDIAYWLTDTMPAYLTWFGENWTNVFTDIASGTATIFTNLASNIGNAMTAIWEFIKSGGTADLELAWTPLLTGFESTVAALPDIPERAMTELEKAIQTQTEQIGTQLADSYDQMHAEAQAALTLEPPTMPEIDPNLKSGGMNDGQGDAGGTGSKRTNFAVSGLEKGSEAALQAVFAAQKDKTPSQHLAEAKKQTKLLGKMAGNKPSSRIAGKVG